MVKISLEFDCGGNKICEGVCINLHMVGTLCTAGTNTRQNEHANFPLRLNILSFDALNMSIKIEIA
jgi:hypothetical protein